MEEKLFIRVIAAAVSVLVLGLGTSAYAWGGSSYGSSWSSNGSTSTSGGSSSSWSGGNSSTPTCIAANLTLKLATADCLKCHPGDNSTQANMHHKLFNPPPCTSCHTFTGTTLDPVQRDCITCHLSPQPAGSNLFSHGTNVHDAVSHCIVYDSCGNCHKGSLPSIHANANLSGSRYSYHSGTFGSNTVNAGVSACFLCHSSTNATVQKTVVSGLAGQTVSCSNCHGR